MVSTSADAKLAAGRPQITSWKFYFMMVTFNGIWICSGEVVHGVVHGVFWGCCAKHCFQTPPRGNQKALFPIQKSPPRSPSHWFHYQWIYLACGIIYGIWYLWEFMDIEDPLYYHWTKNDCDCDHDWAKKKPPNLKTKIENCQQVKHSSVLRTKQPFPKASAYFNVPFLILGPNSWQRRGFQNAGGTSRWQERQESMEATPTRGGAAVTQ